MKRISLLILGLTLMIASYAQNNPKRIALIIGNAAYQHGGALKNPVNDAVLMAKTLRNLGFEVISKTDASLKTMQMATVNFTNKIKNYDVALFFYAGHGIQVDGENYLIPVDAELNDKAMCQFEALNISSINRAFQENSKNMNIMILDACRNNPFRSWMRGGGRGFKAVTSQAAGTIIAFATREGETASDGVGNNGLFTEKLVRQMNKAQNITEVFQNTRVEVLKASNNAQCPQEWNMLTGNFYFTKQGVSNSHENDISNDEPTLGTVKTIAQFGKIEIETEISGTLYLDGKILGNITKNTKVPVNKVKMGTHTLKIIGDESWEKVITIYKDQTVYVNIKSNKPKDLPGYLTDTRDGKRYKIVDIKGQVWMAENLAFKISSGSWTYNEDQANVVKYGYLYNWETAKKVCPTGWHLPTKEDFDKLLNNYGGSSGFSQHYKALMPGGESGFSASLGGAFGRRSRYEAIGDYSGFWSSSSSDDKSAWLLSIINNSKIAFKDMNSKVMGFSVRCIKD